MNETIELGQMVKDKVTGFAGKAVARTAYLYSPTRIGVQCLTMTPDGTPANLVWIDEGQLIAVTE